MPPLSTAENEWLMGGLVENIPLPPVIDRYVFFFSAKHLFKNKQERADSIWWIQLFLVIFPLTMKDSDNLDKGTHIFFGQPVYGL